MEEVERPKGCAPGRRGLISASILGMSCKIGVQMAEVRQAELLHEGPCRKKRSVVGFSTF